MGSVDYKQLVAFKKKLEGVDGDEMFKSLTKEVGQRLLAKVVKRTPVDTGELRQGWINNKNPTDVVVNGHTYSTKIINPVEYASYVEYGHRQTPGRYVPAIGKRLKKSWVEGQFFLTKSILEMENELPSIIEIKVKQKLGDLFK
mgnify:CR=1 FL=1